MRIMLKITTALVCWFVLVLTVPGQFTSYYVGTPWPPPRWLTVTSSSACLIDADLEGCAYCGPLVTSTGNALVINSVETQTGSVVKTGAPGLTISLQDANAAGSTPMSPDGTLDQSVNLADTSITSNTWLSSGNLSATRSVNPGEYICAVYEFQTGTFTAGDAINFASGATTMPQAYGNSLSLSRSAAGTWTSRSSMPNILFRNAAGTEVGTILGSYFYTVATGDAWHSTNTPNERGNRITIASSIKINGLYAAAASTNSSADYDIILVNGDTNVVSCSIDASLKLGTGGEYTGCKFAEQTLASGDYSIVVKPTNGNNQISLRHVDLNAAGDRAVHMWTGGPAVQGAVTRHNGGTWSSVNGVRSYIVGMDITQVVSSGGSGASYNASTN